MSADLSGRRGLQTSEMNRVSIIMRRRTAYALATLAIFGIEVLIAFFVKMGSSVPMSAMFSLLRSTPLGLAQALVATLAIALTVETAQAFDVVERLGLGGNQLALTVLGGAFDALDFVACTAGAVSVFGVEAILIRRDST